MLCMVEIEYSNSFKNFFSMHIIVIANLKIKMVSLINYQVPRIIGGILRQRLDNMHKMPLLGQYCPKNICYKEGIKWNSL